jgi:uncharacterized protein (DUF362 family)
MKHCSGYAKNTSNSYLSRRDFLKIMALTAAGAALAACQPSSAQPQESAVSDTTEPLINLTKPVVAIAKTNSYDRKLLRSQMEKLFDQIGGVSDVLAHGTRVAIKTNLTGGTASGSLPGIPEIESFLTHPDVVRTVAELLRDAGAKEIFIVEAVYQKASWPAYGYLDMAKEIGATLVDLNETDPYKVFSETPAGTSPFIYDKLKFNPILNEIDAFISVSKMKCHNALGVTHTMKNLVGLVPYRFYTQNQGDEYRSGFHGRPSELKKRLPRVVMDLNTARPVNLSIIDGIWTAEAGEGPWIPAMTQIKPNLLFAGKNPVSTDAVATAAMGFDPTAEYPDAPFVNAENHLNIAASLGMGTNKIEEIKVVGEKIDDVVMQFTPSY